MNLSGNIILITGGGSGIGLGLSEAFHQLGNQVIIAGRRADVLERVAAAHPGMRFLTMDVESAASIRSLAERAAAVAPSLNVLINNAGIMRTEDVQADHLADAEAIVNTNLLGPIRLTNALLPLLSRQPASTIINVSSGLAFVPLAQTPTYCATKAAIHSYTQSLRHQLRETSTEVIELIPPYVGTELMSGSKGDPRAMPLADFITEVMANLRADPGAREICVERVKGLRFAAQQGKEAAVFEALNSVVYH